MKIVLLDKIVYTGIQLSRDTCSGGKPATDGHSVEESRETLSHLMPHMGLWARRKTLPYLSVVSMPPNHPGFVWPEVNRWKL